MKTKTEIQYKQDYIPCGAWVLIEKDQTPDKVGSIYIPEQTKGKNVQWTSTGTIISKSPWTKFQDEWDEYLYGIYKVGDRVGFSNTVPMLSPAPPFYTFEKHKTEDARYVTLHVTDIICILVETEEAKKEFQTRFKNG